MKRAITAFLTAGLLFAIAGCSHTSKDGQGAGRTVSAGALAGFTSVSQTNVLSPDLLRANPEHYFTLGPGDHLELQVIGQPESRAETFVGPDGKVYFYLLPGIDVWGLTLSQARDQMEKELAKFVTNPEISVSLRRVGSKYVWLLGRLNRPGIYPVTAPMSLLEGVALAGGTARSTSQVNSQDLADLRHSFVMRKGQHLPVDFYRLLREGDLSQNIILEPDDFVYVPSALSQEVYLLGAVRNPRAVPFTEGMTVIGALAGGNGPVKYDWLSRYDSSMARDAYLSHVAIVRGSLAEPRIAVVNCNAIIKGAMPDVPLEPGDIVYVPNSPYRFLKSYLNLIVNSFVSTVAANEGIRAGGGAVGVGVSVPVGGR